MEGTGGNVPNAKLTPIRFSDRKQLKYFRFEVWCLDVQNWREKYAFHVSRRCWLNAKLSLWEIKWRGIKLKAAAIKSPKCVRVKVKAQRAKVQIVCDQSTNSHDNQVISREKELCLLFVVRRRGAWCGFNPFLGLLILFLHLRGQKNFVWLWIYILYQLLSFFPFLLLSFSIYLNLHAKKPGGTVQLKQTSHLTSTVPRSYIVTVLWQISFHSPTQSPPPPIPFFPLESSDGACFFYLCVWGEKRCRTA